MKRSDIRVGGLYRNGPGQLREVLSVTDGVVAFKVTDPGPKGEAKFSQLQAGPVYQNKLASFTNWATAEVEA